MRLLRLFLLAGLFVLPSAMPAMAGQVPGDGGRIERGDAQDVLKRYGSIPGNGVVKGEGSRIKRGHAHDILERYGSIPGNGVVRGEGSRIKRGHAHDILGRYGSIPGNGVVKGEGSRIKRGHAHDILKRYGSIPGNGVVKGEGSRIKRGHAHDVLERYGSIPGNGVVKGDGRRIKRGHAQDVLKRYGSIPGNGVVKGDGRRIEHEQARKIADRYGSIPGGLILEGSATGLNGVRSARYDGTRAALVLDDRLVYALPVPANSAATLARAIAEDDRLGVSLAEKGEIVFGRLPAESDVARDLKLADNFLGDFILPPREWTMGYRLAKDFELRSDVGEADAAVLFRFRGFKFARRGDKLELSGARFEARVVPILEQEAPDGGYLPDFEAISEEGGLDAYEANAKHVGTNIGYYLGEKVVARAMAYGEAAAVLRKLKAAGIDLRTLARSMESASIIPVRLAPAVTLEEYWMAYLKDIQAAGTYANWSSPPYDLYLNRKR